MVETLSILGLWLAVGAMAAEPAMPAGVVAMPSIAWHNDYDEATRDADAQGRMLLLYFHDQANRLCQRFDQETLADPAVRARLADYVCARLPIEAAIVRDGKAQVLLKHPSFAEMQGKPGIAIVDYVHRDTNLHGSIVSEFPLTKKLWYGPKEMGVILDLPPGTLTQRTLIYAVRIHPEGPASTTGQFDPRLAEEAQKHADYQARLRRQGHQHWKKRFRQIMRLLPRGLIPKEVCAESWPGENLVEAAIECVHSWRRSSGHWSAVRAKHDLYGYDMKRGPNRIWYATGIFGSR